MDSSTTGVKLTETQSQQIDEDVKEKVEEPNPNTNLVKETTMKDDEPMRLWTNIISGNRNPSNGLHLDLVPLQIVDGKI